MKSKSIRRNYFLNLGYQTLHLIIPLITAPYISRVLGSDGVGKVSYTESIATYFTLFATMGLTVYGQRETAYVRDSLEKRSLLFWNTKAFGACTGAVALAAYLLFSLKRENAALFLVFAFNVLAVIVDVTWFFQGLEEFDKIVGRNTVLKILNVLYIFLVIKDKDDLLLYAFGLAGFTCLGNLSLWGYLPKYIQRVPLTKLTPFKDAGKIVSLFIPTVAIQIYTVLDKTMIGAITKSSFENGYYEQAVKISKAALTLVTALGTVMIPRIGYHFAQRNEAEIRRLLYRGYRFVWFLGVPLCFGLLMVAGNIVPWFYGPGYEQVTPLLRVLCFLILAIGINMVTGNQYLIPTGKQNLYTLSVVLGACVNFVLNLVLIRYYRSTGAAIASVAAESAIAIVQLILVRKELSPRRVIAEGMHYYIAGGVMALALWPVAARLSPSVGHTILIVACGAAVYFGTLCIERDEFFLSNVREFAGKLRRNGRFPCRRNGSRQP